MKPPVEVGIASRLTPEGLNRQLNQIRDAVNRVLAATANLATLGAGTATAIWTDPDEMGHDTHAAVDAQVIGTDATGANYGNFHHAAAFVRPATGAAAQLGATQLVHPDIVSNVAITLAVSVVDGHLTVTVNDGAMAAMDWKAWIEVRKG